jgi:mycothiol synthase
MPFTTRPASSSDAAGLATLLTRCRRHYLGRESSLAEAIEHLSEPGTDPQLDAVAAVDASGAIVGFGRVWRAGDEIKCFARVDPDATGHGIGTALLDALERRAAEIAPTPDTELTLTQWAADGAATDLLRGRRFTESRFFLSMVADLTGTAPEVPPAPAGVTIRTLEDGDEEQLLAAFAEAFASHPGRVDEDPDTWWQERRENASAGFDPTLWLIAVEDGSIVGFSLGRELVADGVRSGYVGDVGVRPPWQGRGLGHTLLAGSLAEFRRRGLASASLNVDAENTSGALALYRKAGMEAKPAFTIWAKRIVG